jgi:hypothetical protein
MPLNGHALVARQYFGEAERGVDSDATVTTMPLDHRKQLLGSKSPTLASTGYALSKHTVKA